MEGILGMNQLPTNRLTREEENFLGAGLWEEWYLVKGPATLAAQEHGLSILRCLEPVNRLSANFYGEALNRLAKGPCPPTAWPWSDKTGKEVLQLVLQLLWNRLTGNLAAIGESSKQS